MTKRKFEKLQRGNPHKLIVDQHVFPVASIKRFANASGRVAVADAQRRKVRQAKPSDSIFCARRAWDYRAEAGYMRSIEAEFQALADAIVAGTVDSIDKPAEQAITLFWALWRARSDFRNRGNEDAQLRKVTGARRTKDEEERFEKRGVGFIREGGIWPVRQMNGLMIQRAIDDWMDTLMVRWKIIRADDGEFLVPDAPANTIVPVTPTLVLMDNEVGGAIVRKQVAEVNSVMLNGAHQYCFARDFSRCPR